MSSRSLLSQRGHRGGYLTLALFAFLAVAGVFTHQRLYPEPPAKGLGWGLAGMSGAEVLP